MIARTPHEARRVRPEPRRALPASLVERMARSAFPRCRVTEAQPLAYGLRNANFKLRLDGTAEPVVLRIYEHDGSICRKETDLLRLVGRSIPVPEVIHAELDGWEDAPPFALLSYVEGITFRELKRAGNADETAQAAHSAGQILAAIGRFGFAKAGWLGPGATVCAPLLEGAQTMPRLVDLCLESANLRERMEARLREGVHTAVRQWAPRLSQLEEEARLVHGDFGKRNLVVRNVMGKWAVAAVLDWEFAVSGTPLADLGHFVCYERSSRPLVEPHFSKGYQEAGGSLPEDWRQVARIVDLTSLCESLTHEYLPGGAAAELIELVRATVENRDPE